jgi:hypothetical protein
MEEMKLEKMLDFHEIIQSWTRDEEKDVDIESKYIYRLSCQICMV